MSDTIKELRDKDYCVVVFSPEEMNGVDCEGLASWMIERGWDYIEMSQPEEEEETLGLVKTD
jgi:hypothetical protein